MASGSNDTDAVPDEDDNACPICLNELDGGQELGVPESCQHCFCLLCIREWSRAMNTCPIDRQPFNLIRIKNRLDGPVVLTAPVRAKKLSDIPSEEDTDDEDDVTYCEVCGSHANEVSMLLCDGCDAGYHMECLTPALTRVPRGQWFCPECRPPAAEPAAPAPEQAASAPNLTPNRQRDRFSPDFIHSALSLLRQPTPTVNRRIPRTEVAERVRIRIARRLQATSDEDSDDEEGAEEEAVNDDEDAAEISVDSEPEEDIPSTSTAVRSTAGNRTFPAKKSPAKKTPPKRRKRRAPASSNKKRRAPIRRRRRKKGRRRGAAPRAPRAKPNDAARNRLAANLGVRPPKAGHFLPNVKDNSGGTNSFFEGAAGKAGGAAGGGSSSFSGGSQPIGGPQLSIVGNGVQLGWEDSSDSDGGEEANNNNQFSSASQMFNQPISRLLSNRAEAVRILAMKREKAQNGGGRNDTGVSSSSSAVVGGKGISGTTKKMASSPTSSSASSTCGVSSSTSKPPIVEPPKAKKAKSWFSSASAASAAPPTVSSRASSTSSAATHSKALSINSSDGGSGGLDVLDDIFAGQTLMSAPTKHVQITKDGKLRPKQSFKDHASVVGQRMAKKEEHIVKTVPLAMPSTRMPTKRHPSTTSKNASDIPSSSTPGGSMRAPPPATANEKFGDTKMVGKTRIFDDKKKSTKIMESIPTAKRQKTESNRSTPAFSRTQSPPAEALSKHIQQSEDFNNQAEDFDVTLPPQTDAKPGKLRERSKSDTKPPRNDSKLRNSDRRPKSDFHKTISSSKPCVPSRSSAKESGSDKVAMSRMSKRASEPLSLNAADQPGESESSMDIDDERDNEVLSSTKPAQKRLAVPNPPTTTSVQSSELRHRSGHGGQKEPERGPRGKSRKLNHPDSVLEASPPSCTIQAGSDNKMAKRGPNPGAPDKPVPSEQQTNLLAQQIGAALGPRIIQNLQQSLLQQLQPLTAVGGSQGSTTIQSNPVNSSQETGSASDVRTQAQQQNTNNGSVDFQKLFVNSLQQQVQAQVQAQVQQQVQAQVQAHVQEQIQHAVQQARQLQQQTDRQKSEQLQQQQQQQVHQRQQNLQSEQEESQPNPAEIDSDAEQHQQQQQQQQNSLLKSLGLSPPPPPPPLPTTSSSKIPAVESAASTTGAYNNNPIQSQSTYNKISRQASNNNNNDQQGSLSGIPLPAEENPFSEDDGSWTDNIPLPLPPPPPPLQTSPTPPAPNDPDPEQATMSTLDRRIANEAGGRSTTFGGLEVEKAANREKAAETGKKPQKKPPTGKKEQTGSSSSSHKQHKRSRSTATEKEKGSSSSNRQQQQQQEQHLDDKPKLRFSEKVSVGDNSNKEEQRRLASPAAAPSDSCWPNIEFLENDHQEIPRTKLSAEKTPMDNMKSKTKNSKESAGEVSSDNGNGSRKDRPSDKASYQSRVEEEVKQVLRVHYANKQIDKEQYKEIMRKAVPKITKRKGSINPVKIQQFVEAYVQKAMEVKRHRQK